MALSPSSDRYIRQQGLIREVDVSTGPAGPNGVTAYFLVPASGWQNGTRYPHVVYEDLKSQGYEKTTVDGIEYFKVPEESSSNLPGRLAHYATTTGVAELQNPPGGGVNRVVETLEKSADATVAPDEVAKFVKENDSYEEARKTEDAANDQVAKAVGQGEHSGSPAREPDQGKLVVANEAEDKPAPKRHAAPKTDK